MRAKKEELLRAVQGLRGRPEHKMVLDLLEVMLDEVKNTLVVCDPADFAHVQGQAKAYSGLIRMIERPSPPGSTREM